MIAVLYSKIYYIERVKFMKKIIMLYKDCIMLKKTLIKHWFRRKTIRFNSNKFSQKYYKCEYHTLSCIFYDYLKVIINSNNSWK